MQNYENYLKDLNAKRERLTEFLTHNRNKTNSESANRFLNFLKTKEEFLRKFSPEELDKLHQNGQ